MSLLALTRKEVLTVEPHTTLLGAARTMMEHSVGALVVSDASGEVATGIVTDRDLLYMVSEGLDPKETTVACFVQEELQTVSVGDSLSDVTAAMRKHGVRRLPILDTEGRLAGLVSFDDILMVLGRELADLAGAVGEELDHERRMEALRAEIGGELA
ncbi:MAG: CBS domain-containing protein [Myxococcota bacterium]|nr:CBS domain-containing protein [Myxococcota bacterium]